MMRQRSPVSTCAPGRRPLPVLFPSTTSTQWTQTAKSPSGRHGSRKHGGHRRGYLVAEAEAGIVGFASFGPSQDIPVTAEIGTLYAMPEVWGTEIGKQLMLATLAALGQADYTQATLWVLEDNERARRFYEAAGWGADGAAVEDSTGGASLNKLRYRRPLG
ncbi:GNAT family N-acetyltransferase [Stenotrophomonas sp. NPDC087984]